MAGPDRTSLDERIARVADFTPAERRIATVLAADPTVVAFDTVAELAARIGTSGPTVVRFATKLGFAGYARMQQQVRDDVVALLRQPNERLRSVAGTSPASLDGMIDQAHTAIDHVRAPEQLEAIVGIAETVVAATGTIWVVASETSSPVAQLLASNLGLVRHRVVHVAGSSAAVTRAVVDAGPDDCVLAIDVERYESAVARTVGSLAGRGARVVAIADSPLAPIVRSAEHWCRVNVSNVGPFDSAVPIVAVAELVVAAVAERLRETAAERLDAMERVWREHDVFIDAPDGGTSHSR